MFDFQGEGSDAEDDDDIDGIFVWYAALGPATSSRSLADEGSEGKDFQVVTLHHIDADASGGYTVGGLTPHTRYAFFLIPFFNLSTEILLDSEFCISSNKLFKSVQSPFFF